MATNLDNSGRAMLNEYLEKPLELDSGQLSTQMNMSATSLSSGGLDGLLTLRKNGIIVVHDGSNRRVKLGKLN